MLDRLIAGNQYLQQELIKKNEILSKKYPYIYGKFAPNYEILKNEYIEKEETLSNVEFNVYISEVEENIRFKTNRKSCIRITPNMIAISTDKFKMKMGEHYINVDKIGKIEYSGFVAFKYENIKELKVVKRCSEICESLIIELDEEEFSNQIILYFYSYNGAKELYNMLIKRCNHIFSIREEKEKRKKIENEKELQSEHTKMTYLQEEYIKYLKETNIIEFGNPNYIENKNNILKNINVLTITINAEIYSIFLYKNIINVYKDFLIINFEEITVHKQSERYFLKWDKDNNCKISDRILDMKIDLATNQIFNKKIIKINFSKIKKVVNINNNMMIIYIDKTNSIVMDYNSYLYELLDNSINKNNMEY